MLLTPNSLHAYAASYASERESQGKGTLYPTVRECAKHFRVRQQTIAETVSEPLDGDQYLGLIVGHRMGNGISPIDKLGDQQVEAY